MAHDGFDFQCFVEQAPFQLVVSATRSDGSQFECAVVETAVLELTKNTISKLTAFHRFLDAALHNAAKNATFRTSYVAYEAPKGAGQALVVTIAAKPNEWDDPVEFSLTLRPAAPSLNRLIAELASLKKKVEKLESEQSSASASCTSTFNADGAMLNALRGDLKYYESALARLFKLEAAQPAAKPAKETTVLQGQSCSGNGCAISWQLPPALFVGARLTTVSYQNDTVVLPAVRYAQDARAKELQGVYFIAAVCTTQSTAQNQPLTLSVGTIANVTNYFPYAAGQNHLSTCVCNWTGTVPAEVNVTLKANYNHSWTSASLTILKFS